MEKITLKTTPMSLRTMRPVHQFCYGLISASLLCALVAGCSRGSDDAAAGKQPNPIAILESAPASNLKPSGDLAEIFALGSDFTQLQREITVNEIKGKVVEWRLPVYEVSKVGDIYRIQTSPGSGVLGSEPGSASGFVRTFVYISLRKDDDRLKIEAIKTGDWVAFKGVIADVTLRILEIRPAILFGDRAVLTKADVKAAIENKKTEASDWKAATRSDTVEGYTEFLKVHEDSDMAKYARVRIKRARAETEAANRPLPDDATRRQWQGAAEKTIATLRPGATFKECPDCPVMVIIPAGSYQMGEKGLYRFHGYQGSSGEGEQEEIRSEPVHLVTFAHPFAMGQAEITNNQWRSLMGTEPANSIDKSRGECDGECPVRDPKWEDVQKFIARLNAKTGKNYRLPSEAEWEYACRGGKREKYCGSNNLDEVAWYADSRYRKDHAVALKKANAFGLYDMSGNVLEWVQDCTNSNYVGAPSDGSAWETGDCEKRIARGGASNFDASDFNPALRFPFDLYGRPVVGIRLARSLK